MENNLFRDYRSCLQTTFERAGTERSETITGNTNFPEFCIFSTSTSTRHGKKTIRKGTTNQHNPEKKVGNINIMNHFSLETPCLQENHRFGIIWDENRICRKWTFF